MYQKIWNLLFLIVFVNLIILSQQAPTSVKKALTRNKRQVDKESFIGFERPQAPSINLIQQTLYNYLEPKPIVDTIREDEKYGNEGDVLGSVGRGIVQGTDTITSFISSTVALPGQLFNRVLRRLSDSSNNVGSRLVGL